MMVEFHMADGTRVDMERLRDLELGPLDLIVRTLRDMHPEARITLGGFSKQLSLRVGDVFRVAIWDGRRLVAEATRFPERP